MSKDKEHTTALAPAKTERPMCVVCGQYDGEMTGSVSGPKNGEAKWHAACEVAHPATVAKVKARAK